MNRSPWRMTKKGPGVTGVLKRNITARKNVVNELLETLRVELGKINEEAEAIRAQSDEMETKVKMQFSEVVVMHKHFLELRQDYLRIKSKYEAELFELRKEIEQLGGRAAEEARLADTVSLEPPVSFGEIYHSKEKMQLYNAIARRGRVSSEILPGPDVKRALSNDGLHTRRNLRTQDEGLGSEAGRRAESQGGALASKAGEARGRAQESDLPGLGEKNLRTELHGDWLVIHNQPGGPKAMDVDLLHTFEGQEMICSVQFSPCGRYLCLGTNQMAVVLDVMSGKEVATLPMGDGQGDSDVFVRSTCFSPDSKLLYTGSEDQKIKKWSLGEKKLLTVFAGHTRDVYTLCLNERGQILYSGSLDETIRKWDVESGECLSVLRVSTERKLEFGVTSLSLSHDGRYLAAGHLDDRIRLWDLAAEEVVHVFEGHQDSIYSVCFVADSDEFFSSSIDKTVRLWHFDRKSPAKSKAVRIYTDHRDFVLSATPSADGKWFISGSKDRSILFTERETGKLQFVLQGHKNSVLSTAFNPAYPAVFASGGGDKKACIWRLKGV